MEAPTERGAMRAILTALFGVVLACSLAACSGGESPEVDAGASQGAAVQSTSAPQPLEIVETGWSVSEGGRLSYVAIVKNPNPGMECREPQFSVLPKDGQGNTICHYLGIPYIVGAGSMVVLTDSWDVGENSVASLDIALEKPGVWREAKPLPEDLYEVSGLQKTQMSDGYWCEEAITGDLVRKHAVPVDGVGSVHIAIVCRDERGTILGGALGLVDNPPMGEKLPFDAACFFAGEPASYEVYVMPGPPRNA